MSAATVRARPAGIASASRLRCRGALGAGIQLPLPLFAETAGGPWTRERCLAALAAYAGLPLPGPLPVGPAYEAARLAGRTGPLPEAAVLVREFGSVERAWLAVLARKRWHRVPLLRDAWRPEEDERLLERAGFVPLARLAWELHRPPEAVRRRLRELGADRQDLTGYLSPAEVAREYGCRPEDVLALIREGALRAVRLPGGRHGIDPADAEAAAARLREAGRWIPLAEAAAALGAGRTLLAYLVQSGRVPVRRDPGRGYRIHVDDLDGLAREVALARLPLRARLRLVRTAAAARAFRRTAS